MRVRVSCAHIYVCTCKADMICFSSFPPITFNTFTFQLDILPVAIQQLKTHDCSRVGWCRDTVPHLVRTFHYTKLSQSKIAWAWQRIVGRRDKRKKALHIPSLFSISSFHIMCAYPPELSAFSSIGHILSVWTAVMRERCTAATQHFTR